MKKMMIMLLVFVGMFCITAPVYAAPAPPLTQIAFTDLTFDNNMQVYVEVTEIGTSSSRFVWANNILCDENINERVILWNSSNIAYGAKRYYKVNGVYAIENPNGTITTNRSGQSYTFTARYHNAMAPWDQQTASLNITMP